MRLFYSLSALPFRHPSLSLGPPTTASDSLCTLASMSHRPVASRGHCDLYKSDLTLLRPGQLFNDSLIHYAFEYVMQFRPQLQTPSSLCYLASYLGATRVLQLSVYALFTRITLLFISRVISDECSNITLIPPQTTFVLLHERDDDDFADTAIGTFNTNKALAALVIGSGIEDNSVEKAKLCFNRFPALFALNDHSSNNTNHSHNSSPSSPGSNSNISGVVGLASGSAMTVGNSGGVGEHWTALLWLPPSLAPDSVLPTDDRLQQPSGPKQRSGQDECASACARNDGGQFVLLDSRSRSATAVPVTVSTLAHRLHALLFAHKRKQLTNNSDAATNEAGVSACVDESVAVLAGAASVAVAQMPAVANAVSLCRDLFDRALPQQANSSDCGPFVVLYARIIAQLTTSNEAANKNHKFVNRENGSVMQFNNVAVNVAMRAIVTQATADAAAGIRDWLHTCVLSMDKN